MMLRPSEKPTVALPLRATAPAIETSVDESVAVTLMSPPAERFEPSPTWASVLLVIVLTENEPAPEKLPLPSASTLEPASVPVPITELFSAETVMAPGVDTAVASILASVAHPISFTETPTPAATDPPEPTAAPMLTSHEVSVEATVRAPFDLSAAA